MYILDMLYNRKQVCNICIHSSYSRSVDAAFLYTEIYILEEMF